MGLLKEDLLDFFQRLCNFTKDGEKKNMIILDYIGSFFCPEGPWCYKFYKAVKTRFFDS